MFYLRRSLSPSRRWPASSRPRRAPRHPLAVTFREDGSLVPVDSSSTLPLWRHTRVYRLKQTADQMSSLKEEFRRATTLQDQLDSSRDRPDSEGFQQKLAEAFKSFKLCKEYADQLSLFSDNESAEDLGTSEIQYMAIDFYLGKLTEKYQQKNSNSAGRAQDRLEVLNRAIRYYLNFLTLLHSYKVLPSSSSNRLRDVLDSNKADEEGKSISLNNIQSSDATTRRADKIERFKMEKSLQERLENLRSTDDEEIQRKVYFAQLGLLSIKTFSALESMNMELELLNEQVKNPANLEEQPKSIEPDESGYVPGRLDPSLDKGPLLNKFGKVNRPFTIVSSRDQINKNVQGTGQYLPTMTVDEYLDEEKRMGRIIEGGGPQSAITEEDDGGDDDEDKHDQETYKAREWDEFVENNPRGSGNTMNLG